MKINNFYAVTLIKPENIATFKMSELTRKEKLVSFLRGLKIPMLWCLWVAFTVVNFYISAGF